MIKANELRIGNLVTWNPGLMSPNSTLPPIQIEISSIFVDKVGYIFPNIENRVESFEDDVDQTGIRYKLLQELEGIELTTEILQNVGFKEKNELLSSIYFEKGLLQLKQNGNHFERSSGTDFGEQVNALPVVYFHQLQNLFFALTGEELEIKLHGQQA
ncbi:MAG: hypothetical protein ACR2KZ_08615 [Segetibacter sp.]